jgi:hypothetical protein
MTHRIPNSCKFIANVSMHQAVAMNLKAVAKRMDWPRSQITDFIVHEHARQNEHDTTLPALRDLLSEKESGSTQ